MDFKNLRVYVIAFQFAIDVHEMTKNFPPEEKYVIISQIRRSSRSICSNIAESYRKRRYKDYFISKLSDADMENAETTVWIDFAFKFGYITMENRDQLLEKTEEIGKLLNYMMNHPEKYMQKGINH